MLTCQGVIITQIQTCGSMRTMGCWLAFLKGNEQLAGNETGVEPTTFWQQDDFYSHNYMACSAFVCHFQLAFSFRSITDFSSFLSRAENQPISIFIRSYSCLKPENLFCFLCLTHFQCHSMKVLLLLFWGFFTHSFVLRTKLFEFFFVCVRFWVLYQ